MLDTCWKICPPLAVSLMKELVPRISFAAVDDLQPSILVSCLALCLHMLLERCEATLIALGAQNRDMIKSKEKQNICHFWERYIFDKRGRESRSDPLQSARSDQDWQD